jgi:hypothetical protein
MRSPSARPYALSGFTVGLMGLTFAVAGCGGSSKPAAVSAGTSAAPLAAASAATAPRKKVVAKGGGNFCQLIAASANNAAISGTSAESIKNRIHEVRALEQQALDTSPDSLKSDVHVLFNASNQIYDALAKANYDYSKIDATTISALQEPDVKQAETRLTDYITNVCKIKP